MRKQAFRYTLAAFRFRRWSRKRYAAFVSRQRCCTMGTLRCNVVERLLRKGTGIVSAGTAGAAGFVAGEVAPDPEDRAETFSGSAGAGSFATAVSFSGGVAVRIVSLRSDFPAAATLRRRHFFIRSYKSGKFRGIARGFPLFFAFEVGPSDIEGSECRPEFPVFAGGTGEFV